MEAARNLLTSPSFPSRTLLKTSSSSPASSSSSSVLKRHEQAAAPVATSFPIASVARHFPTSVLLQEQRDECWPFLHFFKDDKIYQDATDKRQIENDGSFPEEHESNNFCQLSLLYQQQLLKRPGLWKTLLSFETEEDLQVTSAMAFIEKNTKNDKDVERSHAIAPAKRALWASEEALLLDEDLKSCKPEFGDALSTSSEPANFSTSPLGEEVAVAVRSTRLLERRSKRRWVPKPNAIVYETCSSTKNGARRKVSEGFGPNDHLRLFLRSPETKQLLTAKQESELILQVQELIRLENVRINLQSQFRCEPTLVEWAEAVGLGCRVLQSELHSGNTSREKLINANFRMVVHIAKQYQGRGLSLKDLLQEGSLGLMKSVEKFKPRVGCRFATYAYYWIRQTIMKAIFQHSRMIRLPENVYNRLGKVFEAKRLYAREGNHNPSKEELARHVGITVAKLEKLLFTTRMPISMQQPVWSDQDVTFQEVTADPGIEIPDVSVAKQLMRQHVHDLLSFLSPREQRIITLRFGIGGGKQNSLHEIGNMFGLSKERVRQLESRALCKLKQNLSKQGLDAYTELLL